MAKSIRYFMIMVIKQAEQPFNCEAARIYSTSRGKHLKVVAMKTGTYSTQKLLTVQAQTQTGMSVHAISLFSERLKTKSSSRWFEQMTWRNTYSS
jgi:hypothetical protein